MPTLSVNWNYKTFRVTVTPATLLSEVLKESCFHFHLGSDTTLYKLVNRNNKEIDLNLPFRFSNLAQGANLDIVGPLPGSVTTKEGQGNKPGNLARSGGKSENDHQKYVNIRLSVSSTQGTVTVTEMFENSISLKEVLDKLNEKCNLEHVSDDRIAVQIMMRVLDTSEYGKSLANLGLVEGNHALRIRVKPSESAVTKSNLNEMGSKKEISVKNDFVKAEREGDKQSENDDGDTSVKLDSIGADKPQSQKLDQKNNIVANGDIDIKYVQSETKNNKAFAEEHDDSSYELNIEQARIYQRILSKRAADTPMLTKALRQKLEEEEREKKEQMKKSIYTGECTIRIKFPDNKVIQIKIDNRKTLQDLAESIVEKVLKPEIIPKEYSSTRELFFELYIAHPYSKILGRNIELEKTIDDCEFGNRISLQFRFEPEFMKHVGDGGYILDHLLEKLDESDTKTTSESSAISDNPDSSADNNAPVDKKASLSGTKRAKFKQVPAWMKLSKKV